MRTPREYWRLRASGTAGVSVFCLCATGMLAAQPRISPISDQTLLAGSPLHVVADGMGSDTIRFIVTSSNEELVQATIVEGNRSLRIEVRDFGPMLFQLFDKRVPRAANRIVRLANEGFYDGVTFHRVVNDFVIQGGDPDGDGTGGSELGAFSDQFHVDLQHNRTGLLSMAKSDDDTNDSQFFITEGPSRSLDFQHSIFGILVEGEGVRQRISDVAVDDADRPVEPVVMETVASFQDEQNVVIMLKAPEGATGTAEITVVAENDTGAGTQLTFRVDVIVDTINSPPFLRDIPEMTTAVDTPFSFQLESLDVEGDPAFYLDQTSLSANGLPVPVFATPGLSYVVNFDTGSVEVTPSNGIVGRFFITVATAVDTGAVDYQAIPIVVEP